MLHRLLSIGRFARLTGLTVRALRLYDELDLLQPERVDDGTNYRYYATEQLEQAQLIARLRRLDLPLEDVARFLATPTAERHQALRDHRDRLRERAATTSDALRALDDLAKENFMLETEPSVNVTAIVRKALYDQPVMRIRFTGREDEDEDSITSPEAAEIAAVLVRQGLVQAGPPYGISYDPDESGVVTVEVGIPVNSPGAVDGRVEPGTLAGGDVATTLYRGPQDCPPAVLRHLWKEMDAAGLNPDGAPRWVWLTDPSETADPQANLTEVIWPIRA